MTTGRRQPGRPPDSGVGSLMGRPSLFGLVAQADDAGGDADGDGEVGDGPADDRAGADDAVVSDVGQHQGAVADPAVAADGDAHPAARLLADGDIEAVDAVLLRAVHDGDVRAEEGVVLEGDVAEAAVGADVDAPADLGAGMRDEDAEARPAVEGAAAEAEAVEGPPQVDAADA